jgi:hypothetical protein
MPVRWAVDHATRTVFGKGEDILSLADVQHYLQGIGQAATLSYRKLLNLNQCSLALSQQDLESLGRQLNALGLPTALGPAAIVVDSDESYRQMHLFESLTSARRSLRIFRDPHAASQWLCAQPVRPTSFLD